MKLIFERLYFENGSNDDIDNVIDKTIARESKLIKDEKKEFAQLQTAFRRKSNEARNADIRSGKITDLIPLFNRQTAEKFFLGAAAASDYVALDIVYKNLDPNRNGKDFFLVIAEAFRDAASRDDLKMMEWMWSKAENPKNLISECDYGAFFDACGDKAENAVYWMWEKAFGDIDMREEMGMILEGKSRLEFGSMVRRRECQYNDFRLAVAQGDTKKMTSLWSNNLPIDFIKSHDYDVVYKALDSKPINPEAICWLWEKVPDDKRNVMIQTFTPELRDLLISELQVAPAPAVKTLRIGR